jgi:hypothetical protein
MSVCIFGILMTWRWPALKAETCREECNTYSRKSRFGRDEVMLKLAG